MKKIKATFIISTILLLCVTYSSCISIDRKIKLNKDGSGEEIMKISFMKEFYTMMSSMASVMDSARQKEFLDSLYSDEIFMDKTKSGYDSIPGLHIEDIYSQRNPDSSNSFVIKYSFDSISRIGSSIDKTFDENSKKKNSALVTFNKEGDEIVFNYLYEQPSGEDIAESDSLMDEMKLGMAKMFGNGYINIEIEFPYEIISSNATSAENRTLTWNYPISDVFMNSRIKLFATMKQ